MSLGSMEVEVVLHARIDLVLETRSPSICFLVPLVNGSTMKKKVIHYVKGGPICECGRRMEERSQRTSCKYKAKHIWSGYFKKLARVWSSLKRQLEPPSNLVVNKAMNNEVLFSLNLLKMAHLADLV